MGALQKLQEKIEELKSNYQAMQRELTEVKAKLHTLEDSKGTEGQTIRQLRAELEERDNEIENLISKVEELLA